MPELLPAYTTPDALAEHLGVSERALRQRARALGACRVEGKKMILLAEDVLAIVVDMRPCQSESAGAAPSGTTAAP